MNAFKLNALVEEFPFLPETALKRNDGETRNIHWCDRIEIKRVTPELLGTTPNEYSWDGSLVGISEWERVDFVLSNGSIIIDAVKLSGESGSNYAHSATHKWEGETILEAIYRHSVADSLAFIVWTSGGYNVENHYSEPNWQATIYKPAKDFTLTEAITEAQVKAKAEVQAEAAF